MRRCGECAECCRVLPVADLPGGAKPRGVRCKYLAPEGGCAVYSERPRSCRDFTCLWLTGWAGTMERPDLVGVVFTLLEAGGMLLPTARVAPAGLRGHGADLVERIRPLILMRADGWCEVLGPLPLRAAVGREALREPKRYPELQLADKRVRWRMP